ncbi:hypothetical protein DFA_02370 [Cavenderia fasciculata]|uniref:EGF-like domain-containing protein n=1 Tax=Cavenderia fasciculata TaxID=261658 RepID=F4PZ94_CACFS|nr:uncharacterized protein DFA_02370 [Cavenderia fasciculata]EGG19123.1 hypothetical protein DFA_02370 [Cavenderia fasciculata]|eukprot:XP_004366756.1 hypothetical protein DFA_02370 [Cavenderia fasciculata]
MIKTRIVLLLLFTLFVSLSQSQSITVTSIVAGVTTVNITYEAVCSAPTSSVPKLNLTTEFPCVVVGANTVKCTGLTANTRAEYDFFFFCGQVRVNVTEGKTVITTYPTLDTPFIQVRQVTSKSIKVLWAVSGGNPALNVIDVSINNDLVASSMHASNFIIDTLVGVGSHPIFTTIYSGDGSQLSNSFTFDIYPDLTYDININDLGSNSAIVSLSNVAGNDAQTKVTYYVNDNVIIACIQLPVTGKCNLTNLTPNSLHTLKVYGINGVNLISNTTFLNFTTSPPLDISYISGYQTDNTGFTIEYTSTGGTETPLYSVYVNGTVYCEDDSSEQCNIDLTNESLISQHTILLKASSLPDSKDDRSVTFNTWKAPEILNITGVVNDKGQIVLGWDHAYGNPNEPFSYTVSLTNDTNQAPNDICYQTADKTCTSNSTGTVQYIVVLANNDNFNQIEYRATFNFTLCAVNSTGPLCSGHGVCGNDTLGCTCNPDRKGTLCQTKIETSSGGTTTGTSHAPSSESSSDVPNPSSSFSLIYGPSVSSYSLYYNYCSITFIFAIIFVLL